MEEITSKEAAVLMGVSTARIRQFIKGNRVRSRKIGNLRLIKLEDIGKLIDQRAARKAKGGSMNECKADRRILR
jgi:excisionase family DNA binding protein